MKVCRRFAMAQNLQGLNQPGNAGRAFQVTDIGLHRSQHHRLFAIDSQHILQCFNLDRIAQRRAGAVALDIVQICALPSRFLQRLTEHRLLCQAVWRGQRRAAAILVHGTAFNDAQDRIAVGLRIAEALQHYRADAFATGNAVSPSIESRAPAIGAQHLRLAGEDVRLRRKDQVNAAGDRHPAGTAAQLGHRGVDRHQRRGAGRVNGHAGAGQIEQIRNAVGGD
ncbi:Uncharacterised protein [Serratia entomophila]|nr:Uncharacterised protein [Serratia entomophila]CAI1015698.1 Uncharacterised protein [Serratia entomophila]CAI1016690.1 Uncharacterised protein [Serratia entomophila]CAI1040908.1 Uncharacterised protein [Serratia entomophila]CAI1063747.1 Uncharacterised protein [Serratia entomophila]